MNRGDNNPDDDDDDGVFVLEFTRLTPNIGTAWLGAKKALVGAMQKNNSRDVVQTAPNLIFLVVVVVVHCERRDELCCCCCCWCSSCVFLHVVVVTT